jgi:glycosyltransferase involved in cell wall biosynthesis
MNSEVKISLRSQNNSLLNRMRRRVLSGRKSDLSIEIERFLNLVQPELVIISAGWVFPPIEWLELCRGQGLPFLTIAQANSEHWWLEDEIAARYRQALRAALRCYFVSQANLQLMQKQIGAELPNAEVVRNPFNVDFNTTLRWPSLGEDGAIRLACVARLDPRSKGQDILLEALANPVWINRPWQLTLYGNGPFRNVIERLVQRFGLGDRVTLAGYVSRVVDIWAENHVLVMPSRFEGLPLAMVEAMLCGRPIVATDVAGHSEIVEDGVSGFLADAPTVPSVAGTLERLWKRRHDLEAMGQAAARKIRDCVPADPAGVFCKKLLSLLVAPREAPSLAASSIHRLPVGGGG